MKETGQVLFGCFVIVALFVGSAVVVGAWFGIGIHVASWVASLWR